MNRLLQYVRCPHCEHLRSIQAQLDRASDEAARIEAIAGTNVIEFWIPSASRVVEPKVDDDGDLDDVGIRLMIQREPRLADIAEDLERFTVGELRRIAGELLDAADAIEAGGEGVHK